MKKYENEKRNEIGIRYRYHNEFNITQSVNSNSIVGFRVQISSSFNNYQKESDDLILFGSRTTWNRLVGRRFDTEQNGTFITSNLFY